MTSVTERATVKQPHSSISCLTTVVHRSAVFAQFYPDLTTFSMASKAIASAKDFYKVLRWVTAGKLNNIVQLQFADTLQSQLVCCPMYNCVYDYSVSFKMSSRRWTWWFLRYRTRGNLTYVETKKVTFMYFSKSSLPNKAIIIFRFHSGWYTSVKDAWRPIAPAKYVLWQSTSDRLWEICK